MCYKKWIIGILVLALIISGISSTSFGFDNVTPTEESHRKPNLIMGVIGIGCILYGLQANTETFEWDFLTQVYVHGSGDSEIVQSYEDPDPYTIKYIWTRYKDDGLCCYEYTYNHHSKEQRTANIPIVVLGLALFINAFQEGEEENISTRLDSKFAYSLDENGFKVGYSSSF